MSKSNYRNQQDSTPTPVVSSPSTTTSMPKETTIEEMEEQVRALKAQIELKKREAERIAAQKAAAEAAAAKEAEKEAEFRKMVAEIWDEMTRDNAQASSTATPPPLPSRNTKANYADGFNGPGMGYKYPNYALGCYSLTSDIWKAKRISNGVYDPIWVWYKDGRIDHILDAAELEKYVL